RNQVTGSQQLVQLHISHKIQIRVFVHIVGDHFHAKSMADPGHGGADPSGSHNTCRFSVEVYAHQTLETEIVLPDLHIGFMEMTVYSQRQRHSVFCHRLGRIARHPHHLDAVSGGCLQIHIVETGAAHQHQLHASLM